MTEIRLLTAEDHDAVEQMKQIWRECFDAEDAYLELYFSVRYRPEETLVYCEDGQVLGMLTILPCTCRAPWNGQLRQYRGAYLFAVGTLPQAQGRGIATKLLSEADRYLQSSGVEVSMLAPAEPSLFQFYEQRGYEPWFYQRRGCLPAVERGESTLRLKALSAREYADHYSRLLPQDAMVWPEDAFPFAERESRLYHGGLYALMQGERQVAICNLYRYQPQMVIVKELLMEPGEDEQSVVEELRRQFPQAELDLRLPANAPGRKELALTPVAMLRFYGAEQEKPQNTQRAYCSFLLD